MLCPFNFNEAVGCAYEQFAQGMLDSFILV